MTRTFKQTAMALMVGMTFFISSCSEETPPVTPQAELTVSMDPAEIYLGPGGSATVNIKIEEAADVVSWRAVLKYDPDKLQVFSLKIRDLSNNFLAQSGASIIESDRLIDTDNGTIIIGALAQRYGFNGVDGDGTLAQFKISSPTSDPSSSITFESVELYKHPVANPPVVTTPKIVNTTIKKGS